MFFIFGWGHQTTKQFGSGIHARCPQCHNGVGLMLLSVTKWFTLFFIPVIPYDSGYLLTCPICARGVKIDEAQFNKIREGTIDPAKGDTFLDGLQTRRLVQKSGVEEALSAVVVCPYCSEEIELDKNEVRSRRFTCPICEKSVEVDASAARVQ